MNTLSSLLNFIGSMIAKIGVVEVSKSAVSSLPAQINNSAIRADHVVVGYEIDTPSAQASVWEVTTYAGYLRITGTIKGTTDIKLRLEPKVN